MSLALNKVAEFALDAVGSTQSFAPDDAYLAIPNGTNSPYVRIFKRAGSTWDELSSPFSPAVPAMAFSVEFSPNGQYLAVVHQGTSPHLSMWRRTGDTFEQLSSPFDSPPAGGVFQVAWSADSTYFALTTFDSGEPLIVYKRDGDDFERLDDPPWTSSGLGYNPSFSPNGDFLVCGADTDHYLQVYKRSGDTFGGIGSFDAVPGTPNYVGAAAWSADSNYLFLLSDPYPAPLVYERTVDDFDLISSPDVPGAADFAVGLSFAESQSLLAATFGGTDDDADTVYIYDWSAPSATQIAGQPSEMPSIDPSATYPSVRFGSDYCAITYANFDTGEAPLFIYKIEEVTEAGTMDVLLAPPIARFGPLSVIRTTTAPPAVHFGTYYSKIDTTLASPTVSASGDAFLALRSGATSGETFSLQHAWGLRERAAISDSAVAVAQFLESVVDATVASDSLLVVRDFLLSDGLTVEDVVSGTRVPILTLVDALITADLATSSHHAVLMLASALAINESTQAALTQELIDALQADDTLASRIVTNSALLSAALLESQLALQMQKTATLIDRPELSDEFRAGLVATETARDTVAADAVLLLEGIPYSAWVINAESGAPSEYQNWNFESMCRLGDRYYAASESGLFRLDGDDDDGNPIEASLRTGDLDFGSPQIKRPIAAHLAYAANGDMAMKVTVAHEGKRTEYWYRCNAPVSGTATEAPLPLGKGLASRHWQFELLNVNGADFEFDAVHLQMLELSRRV